MAGLGGAWGSREEFLHPRDRHGRFRKKWQMAAKVIDAISNFLDGFNPRTFQSDGQSAQYLFNRAKPSRFGGGSAYPRLHADYDEANANLRAGNMDESTKKFVKMMDDSAINLDSDIILSRTVGPDAFGLTPEQLGLEDGGIEDFTGRLIADRGYSAANIGTPMSHGPGKVTMSIAVPKGTKAIIPARSPNDRGIFLDRDQELRITKVKPDGTGGFYVMAVATPRTPGNTPEPIDRSPRGVGLTPQEREARVVGTQQLQAKREGIVSDAKINSEAIQQGTQQVKAEQPTPQAPGGGPPPRNEPIHAESIGGADTQGKGTAEIAQTKAPEAPAAPALPPEAPPAHVPDIRSAVREGKIPSPTDGTRRREWNNAFLGVASGKKNPEDMLRELEADIKKNRGIQEEDKTTGRKDPHLADDIKAQDQLADAIAREFGLQRQVEPAPAKKVVPSKVTPIAQAPGEKHRGIPGEVGTRQVTNLEARRAAKAVQAPRAPQREEPTPPPVPKKAPELAKVIPIKKAAPAAPESGGPTSGMRELVDQLRQRREAAGIIGQPTEADTRAALGRLSIPQLRQMHEDLNVSYGRGNSPPRGVSKQALINNLYDEVTGHGRRTTGDDSRARVDLVDAALKIRPHAASVPVVKKAAPAAPTPEAAAAPDIDKMTKAELLAHARSPEISANVRTSMTKDQIKQEIRRAQEIGPPEPGSRVGKENQFKEAGLGGTVKELQIIADQEGVPRRGRPTNKAKLQEAILANRAERATSGVAGTRRINTHGGAESTGLTTEQYNALSRYMGGGFGPANRSLRGRARQGDTATDAAVMDELMATSPMTEDKKVFRGLRTGNGIFGPRDQRPKDLKGFEWTDEGFVSTALNEDSAADFAKGPIGGEGGILLRMNVPKGTNALDLRGGALNEDEVLLQRGLRMRVTGEGGTRRLPDGSTARILDVDVLPPGETARAVEPNAPAAQKAIQAPDRKASFEEAWAKTRIEIPNTAAGRSIKEVHSDVASGKITPDEGIRRLENDIDLNKGDLAEIEQELRGDHDLEERLRLKADQQKLRLDIKKQEAASAFMRDHFRQAPAVTPKEVEVQLDPEAKQLVEGATPDDIREAAKIAGFGELKGENKDELLQDLVKKIAGKELASRAAKKAAPKKLAPAPLVTKKSNDPDYVDAKAIAEGLDMNESDSGMLSEIQDMLDGKGRRQVTPAAAGRFLKDWAHGPAGPAYKAAVITGLGDRRDRTPDEAAKIEADHASARAQLDRWDALAERLTKTRRRPARKATEPAPEKPKLTTEEKKVTAQAAEVLGVPKEQLQSRALAKKVAAAPPPESAKSVVEQLGKMDSMEEGHAFLKNRTKAELQEIAKASNAPVESKDTKEKLIERIVGLNIGSRLRFEEFRQARAGSTFRGDTTDAPKVTEGPVAQILSRINAVDADNVPVMSKKEVADLIANTKKADLVEMAKTYNVPSPSNKTAAELRTWIVDASVGNRIDSIATRGFTGSRPTQGPEGKALENLLPAQLAQIESDLGIKRTSLDRADRIAAIKAAQAEKSTQASIPKSLPSSGRKWDWEKIQEDGGTMHGDSASMNLAQKLHKAGREDAAQYVADMRYHISNSHSEHDAADVEKMVSDLKKMRDAEADPALKRAYDRALEDIDAPELPVVPKLPEGTPAPLRKMMNELNQIPVARRTGHFAGTRKEVSAVDRLAQLIQKVEAGDAGSIGTVESEIDRILRSFHESVDGAYQMWRLGSLIDNIDIRKWIRSHYPKT